MKLIKAIVRPNMVDNIKEALGKLNIAGMTVTGSIGLLAPAGTSIGIIEQIGIISPGRSIIDLADPCPIRR